MDVGNRIDENDLERRTFLRLVAGGLGAVWAGTGEPSLAQAPSAAPAADFETTGVTAGEVKIGMSAAFKGAIAGLGIDYYRGAQALYEEISSKGGIAGRRIRVVPLNDSYDPDVTLKNTIRLLDEEKVFVLSNYIGSINMTRTLPLLRRYRDRGLVLVGDLTGAQPQREEPYADQVFNIRASYRRESIALVDEFWKLGMRKFGVFYQIDAFGRSGWDGVVRGLAKYRASITSEATYHRGAKFGEDMGPAAEHLRAAGVDVVILIAVYQSATGFIRAARAGGWNVPMANISPVGSETMLASLVEEGTKAGKDFTKNLVNSQIVPSYDEVQLPAVKEYRELIDKWNPAIPVDLRDPDYKMPKSNYSYSSLEGFVNAKVVVEALRRAGTNLTRSGFRAALESMGGYDPGIGAPLAFSPTNHQGIDRVYFTQVVGGRWVPLTDWRQVPTT